MNSDTKQQLWETILDEAKHLTHGDRQTAYGHPSTDFGRTAKIWSALFGVEISSHQVAMALIAVKLSRLTNDPTKRDSWVDIAGYADTGWRVIEKELENEA